MKQVIPPTKNVAGLAVDENYKKPTKKEVKENKKYEDLYIQILLIGQQRLGDGLSYRELLRTLKAKGYNPDKNSCVRRAVEHWFLNSYEHLELQGHDLADMHKNLLTRHVDCGFILKGDSALTLASYKNMNYSLRVANIALLISVIGVLLTLALASLDYSTKEKVEYKTEIQNTEEQNKATELTPTIFPEEIQDASKQITIGDTSSNTKTK